MSKLNLNATVPDSGTDNISTKPLFEITRETAASPITIESKAMFPGANRDYIPHPTKVAKQIRDGHRNEGSKPPRRIRVEPGVDYRSYEDTQKADSDRGSKLLKIAKQIYASHGDSLRRYKIANDILEKATENDLKNPTPQIAKALKIKEAGPPMTKQKARELAEEKLSREEG